MSLADLTKARRERKPRPKRRKGIARRGERERGSSLAIQLVFLFLCAIATVVLAILNTKLGSVDFSRFALFLVLFAICASLEVKVHGGAAANLGFAPLVAAVIVIPYGGGSVAEIVWLVIFGSLIALIIRKAGEFERGDLVRFMIDLTAAGVMGVVFHFLADKIPVMATLTGKYTVGLMVSIGLAAILYFLIMMVRDTYLANLEHEVPERIFLVNQIRMLWAPYLLLAFLGVLMGLVYLSAGPWWTVTLLVPLLIVRSAFGRVSEADSFLVQTLRTLSRIPEETGRVTPGHAETIAGLAGAVARELRLTRSDIEQIEYAAYLHDIGAISKETSKDTLQQKLPELEDIASGGVDIVGKVEYLDVAAEILRGSEGLSERVEDASRRRVVSVGAGIIKAVDDFDSLVRGEGSREPMTHSEALTEMNLERGSKYESKVLRAMARALPRLMKEEREDFYHETATVPPSGGSSEGQGAS